MALNGSNITFWQSYFTINQYHNSKLINNTRIWSKNYHINQNVPEYLLIQLLSKSITIDFITSMILLKFKLNRVRYKQ